jgi:uncharacterized protein
VGALPPDWALPQLTPFNTAWFTSGEIAIQRCVACTTMQHPPEEICHACGAMSFDVEILAPTGTLHSYTVVHYAANAALAAALPYTVALVQLDDAPHLRVVGNLLGDVPAQIGMAVVADWDEQTADDGTRILLAQWRPADR